MPVHVIWCTCIYCVCTKYLRGESMSKQHEGKVVLITGGGGGIGKAAAKRFLDDGARVVLSGTRAEVLEAAQREIDPSGERSAIRAGAIMGREDGDALVREAIERFGAVDVLVNSTGIFRPVPFLEQTEENFEEALCSIQGLTSWATQADTTAMGRRGSGPRQRAAAAMGERGGGSIVNVGSMWAIDAIPTTRTCASSAAQAGRHAL